MVSGQQANGTATWFVFLLCFLKFTTEPVRDKYLNFLSLGCLGCTNGKALGMESGEISDDQITASSQYHYDGRAPNARLNFKKDGGAWSAKTNDLNQWLQVDFQRSTIITGVSTQGEVQYTNFVKSYTVSFSDDESNFQSFKTEDMNPKVR